MTNKKQFALIALFCLILWGAGMFAHKKQPRAVAQNIDISAYDKTSKIPKVGAVTDNREAHFCFQMNGERLYALSLFIGVQGEDPSGVIEYSLEYDGKVISENALSVKQVFAASRISDITSHELVFDTEEILNGKCIVTLKGKGISPETRVFFYGTKTVGGEVVYKELELQKYTDVLFRIEVLEMVHPYRWAATVILIVVLLAYTLWYAGEKIVYERL